MKLSLIVILLLSYCFAGELPDDYHEPASERKNGSLSINVFPKDAQVYINGTLVGQGDQLVSNLEPGEYLLFVKSDKNSVTQQVMVAAETVTGKIINLQRRVFFLYETAFSNSWVDGVRLYGPSVELGIKAGRNLFTANFLWAFWSENPNAEYRTCYQNPWGSYCIDGTHNDRFFGGSVISWQYEVANFDNLVYLMPGIFLGLWETYIGKGWSGTYGEHLGGMSARVMVGRSRIFGSLKYSRFIGETAANQVNVSMVGLF